MIPWRGEAITYVLKNGRHFQNELFEKHKKLVKVMHDTNF